MKVVAKGVDAACPLLDDNKPAALGIVLAV
jgi:hypothetical protein